MAFVLLPASFPQYIGESFTVKQWEQVASVIVFWTDLNHG